MNRVRTRESDAFAEAGGPHPLPSALGRPKGARRVGGGLWVGQKEAQKGVWGLTEGLQTQRGTLEGSREECIGAARWGWLFLNRL